MKYNININQEKTLEWGLNLQQACLIDIFAILPTWAEMEVLDGEVWYFFSKNKILEELPALSKAGKIDTIYRQAKSLIDLGLIDYQKIGRKDYWKLTQKIKDWHFTNSEKNPSNAETSENNPSEVGKKSEENSEKNPTDNNTTGYNNTNNNISLSPANEFAEDFNYKVCKEFLEAHKKMESITVITQLQKKTEHEIILKWADEVRKFRKIDNYSEEQIEKLFKFTYTKEQWDRVEDFNFWQINFQTVMKFRDRNKNKVRYFEFFIDKMKQNKASVLAYYNITNTSNVDEGI